MTLPITTLPIAAASRPARRSVSRTTVAPRSVAGIVLREPLKVPIAVRTGLQRTMSRVLMGYLLYRQRRIGSPRPGRPAEPGATGDRRRDDQTERHQRHALCDEHAEQAAAPLQHQPAATGRDREPREVRNKRPKQAPGSLRGEVERHSEPEQSIGGADRLQVTRAGLKHRRVAIEQREPESRDKGCGEPDGLAEGGRNGGADPGRAQRALALAGADTGPHHGDERAAQAEDERDEEIFE